MKQPVQNYHIMEGFLFKENQLCDLRTSVREKVIRDCIEAGLKDTLVLKGGIIGLN